MEPPGYRERFNSFEDYAIQPPISDTADEEHAMQELMVMLTSRIAEGLRGEVTDKSITDIAEEVLQSSSHL